MTAKRLIGLNRFWADLMGLPTELETVGGEEVSTPYGQFYRGEVAYVATPSDCCRCCGREITNPISRLIGYGPECSARLGVPRDLSEADIESVRRQLQGKRQRLLIPLGGKVAVLLPDSRGVAVTFSYDPEAIEAVRGLPQRSWDGNKRRWIVPRSNIHQAAKVLADKGYTVWSAPELEAELLENPAEPVQSTEPTEPTKLAELWPFAGGIALRTPYDKEIVKLAPALGGRWKAEYKAWIFGEQRKGGFGGGPARPRLASER